MIGQLAIMASLVGMLLGAPGCMDVAEQPVLSEDSAESFVVAHEAATSWNGVIPTDQDCASIDAWLAANQADLPAAYDDVVRFPDGYRRAILAALPPEAQSSLWQQHFQAYRAAHPALSAEQLAFIDKASAMLSPTLFADHDGEVPGPEAYALISDLEASAAELFSEADAYSLLASLGPEDNTTEYTPAARPTCSCSTNSDWCNHEGPGYRCDRGNQNCKRTGGCGTLTRYTCDGRCKRF